MSIPHHSKLPGCTLAGWNLGPKELKKQANFWYKVWLNAERPSNGVLQRKSKLRFKYSVRSIKQRQDHIKRVQPARTFIIETLEFFGPESGKSHNPQYQKYLLLLMVFVVMITLLSCGHLS